MSYTDALVASGGANGVDQMVTYDYKAGSDLAVEDMSEENSQASVMGALDNPATWVGLGTLVQPSTINVVKNFGVKALGCVSTVASMSTIAITGIFGFSKDSGDATLDGDNHKKWVLEHPDAGVSGSEDHIFANPSNITAEPTILGGDTHTSSKDDHVISNPIQETEGPTILGGDTHTLSKDDFILTMTDQQKADKMIKGGKTLTAEQKEWLLSTTKNGILVGSHPSDK